MLRTFVNVDDFLTLIPPILIKFGYSGRGPVKIGCDASNIISGTKARKSVELSSK